VSRPVATELPRRSETTPSEPRRAAAVAWSGSLRRQLARAPVRLAILLLLVLEVVPLVWLLISSFKQESEFSGSPRGCTGRTTSRRGPPATWGRNSVVATFPSIVLIILLSVSAGFGLEILRWRGRNAVLLLFLAGIMVPLQMVLLPLFTMYFKAHLIDNLLSLIITYTVFGLPLSIFLMAGFYKSVPREIIEAAAIDGASIYRTFWQITLPMVRNAILTIALIQFFFIWNDLLLSLTFISNDNLRTVQTGLLNFVGQYGQRLWGPTFASICMAVFPTLLIYLLLNQHVKGLTSGSLKG